MNEFVRGVLFAVGLAAFGKGMYGLGRLKERREANKKMKVIHDGLKKMADILEEAAERAEQEKEEESA